jgi:alanine racemase
VREGIILREAGIRAPICLFSQALPEAIPAILENALTPFVSDGDFIDRLAEGARSAGKRLPVHLKIDTGMGRLGCRPEEATELAKKIAGHPSLEHAGTATHFAVSDSPEPVDLAYTGEQLALFNRTLAGLRAAGLNPGLVHAANSGAIAGHPDARFDMVRPGILLYGYGPGSAPAVRPVMELRTKVVLIKKAAKGRTISYGRTWTAKEDTILGILPVGYADGLPRLAGNKWQVLIGGRPYPLVGTICMDQCLVELGTGSDVARWSEATVFGGEHLGADALARQVGTISYEILCNINKRVPREYVGQASGR